MFIISSTFLNSGSHAIYITFTHSSRMQPASGEFKYAFAKYKMHKWEETLGGAASVCYGRGA
jgi:hypothetical protein